MSAMATNQACCRPALSNLYAPKKTTCGFVRLQVRPQFQVGQKIKIENGVFASCLGLFEGMSDRERVVVLLDLVQSEGSRRSRWRFRRGGLASIYFPNPHDR